MIVRRFTRWLFSRSSVQRAITRRLVALFPDHEADYWIGDRERPVFFHHSLFKLGRWSVSVHAITDTDPIGHFHSHPSKSWRFILSGGYTEECVILRPEGKLPAITHLITWHPGDFGTIVPSMTHRFDSAVYPTFTLWITGPRVAEIEIVKLTTDKRYPING